MEDNNSQDSVVSQESVTLTPEEKKRQRIRSLAIAFALAALVVIFFLATLIRLGSNVADRAL